jgi:hypothetical protein
MSKQDIVIICTLVVFSPDAKQLASASGAIGSAEMEKIR